jgi:hypothetical protein
MNRHDVSGWREQFTERRDWYDAVMTILCCSVMFWWAYEYIERLAR